MTILHKFLGYTTVVFLLFSCATPPNAMENSSERVGKMMPNISEEIAELPSDVDPLEINQLINQSIDQHQKGQFQEAIKILKQVLVHSKKTGDRFTEISTLDKLGFVYFDKGDKTQAAEYIRQYITSLQKLKVDAKSSLSLNSRGGYFLGEGKQDRTVAYNEYALAIIRESNAPLAEALRLNQLGLNYRLSGDFDKASSFYQQSLIVSDRLQDPMATAILRDCDQWSITWDDRPPNFFLKTLIQCREKESSIRGKLQDYESQFRSLSDLGRLYQRIKEHSKAIDNFSHAVVIAQKISKKNEEDRSRYKVDDLLEKLGFSYFYLGNYNKALEYYTKSLEKLPQATQPFQANQRFSALGDVYQAMGNYQLAVKYYQPIAKVEAEERKSSAGLMGRKHSSTISLGSVLLKVGDFAEAARIITSQIERYENISNQEGDLTYGGLITGGDWEDPLLAEQTRAYSLLQQVFITQKRYAEALEISERSRTRSLLLLTAIRHNPKLSKAAPIDRGRGNLKIALKQPKIEQIKQVAKVQNATLVEYFIVYDDLSILKEDPQISELLIWVVKPTGEIFLRRSDLKHFQKQYKTSLQELVTNTRQTVIGGRSVTRSNASNISQGDFVKLKDDNPTWEPWQVLAFNTQSQTLTLRLSSWDKETKPIERPLADVAEKVRSNRIQEIQLQQLHQILVNPIADLLPKDPNEGVIFIPHGELFLVPFPALQKTDGSYLIEKYAIRTAPSIQILQQIRQEHHSKNAKEVLVVGNPTMPEIPAGYGRVFPQKLSPLKESEREAKDIAKLLNIQAITGNAATKEAIVKQMPNARIIHLATHGLFAGKLIALAPSISNNGLLTSREILDLKLVADLVVLSACNTGQGSILGDGLVGLSSSLLVAGASSVIVSLWAIPDAPTAELMTEFYRNLQKGHNKAQALRQAMLTTMKNHPAPRDWAAFTLIGEAE